MQDNDTRQDAQPLSTGARAALEAATAQFYCSGIPPSVSLLGALALAIDRETEQARADATSRDVLACVEVVLYGDACEAGPCEEDDCVACRSHERVDRYFRRGKFAVSSPIQTYTLRPFDVREHMWADEPDELLDDANTPGDPSPEEVRQAVQDAIIAGASRHGKSGAFEFAIGVLGFDDWPAVIWAARAGDASAVELLACRLGALP